MKINIENNKNFSINYKIDDRKFVEIKFDENGNIDINEKYYNEQKKTEDLIDKLNLNSEQLKRIKNINETLDRKPEIEEKPKQTVKELTQEIKNIFKGETKKRRIYIIRQNSKDAPKKRHIGQVLGINNKENKTNLKV